MKAMTTKTLTGLNADVGFNEGCIPCCGCVSKQEVEPIMLDLPAEQIVQLVLPAVPVYVLMGQDWHDTWPVELPNRPAAHSEHDAEETRPVLIDIRPAEQPKHVVALGADEYIPAEHRAQLVAPASEYAPAGQLRQIEDQY